MSSNSPPSGPRSPEVHCGRRIVSPAAFALPVQQSSSRLPGVGAPGRVTVPEAADAPGANVADWTMESTASAHVGGAVEAQPPRAAVDSEEGEHVAVVVAGGEGGGR